MSDVLGDSPNIFYSFNEAKRYNLSGAFKKIQTSMTLDAIELGNFEPCSKILDIGCGTGFSTLVLKKKGFNVVGCDISENMLFFAKEKKLNVVLCDMKILPFSDASFDYAISISAIQWSVPRDYEVILEEINRVIKKSIIIQFYPKNDDEFEYFTKVAKKLFFVEAYSMGVGNKSKKYIILKKRK